MQTLELSNFKAVVSDFDDTIFDNKSAIPGEGLHERSRLDALRAVGVAKSLVALAEVPAELNTVAFHNSHVHSVEGAFWWLLVQQGIISGRDAYDPNHHLIQDLVTAKNISYRKLLETEAQEVPGAYNFFSKLHGQGFADKLGIASTGHRADILRFFEVQGFDSYFRPEHIIAKEDTEHLKPHPESFQRSIESMGIHPSNASKVLAFEDDPRGITAAKELGMYTCAVTTRFSTDELLSLPVPPDVVAADFNEFSKLFAL